MSAAAETTTPEANALAEGRSAALLGARRSALGVFAIRVAGAGLAYGTQVLMARLMGSAGYGIFAAAWVMIVVCGHVSTIGVAQAASRFLPGYRVRGELDLARGYLRWGAFVTLTASLVAAVTGICLLLLGHDHFEGHAAGGYFVPLMIAFAVLPLFALQDYVEGIARSFTWTTLAIAPIYILRQGLIAAAMVAAYFLGRPTDPATAVACTLVATAVSLAIQAFLLRRRIRSVLPEGHRTRRSREWIVTALPIAAAELALSGLNLIDVLLLGLFVPPSEVGPYFAATRIVQLAMFVQFAASAATAPRFAEAHARDDRATLRALVTRTARFATLAMVMVGIGVVVLAPWLLGLFGTGFSGGVPIVAIMMGAIVLQSAFGPGEDVLNMLGAERVAAAISIAAFLLAVMLILALAPTYGVVGAAIAMAVGIIGRSAAQCVAARMRVGIATHIFARGAA